MCSGAVRYGSLMSKRLTPLDAVVPETDRSENLKVNSYSGHDSIAPARAHLERALLRFPFAAAKRLVTAGTWPQNFNQVNRVSPRWKQGIHRYPWTY